jgi:hypothetical protein
MEILSYFLKEFLVIGKEDACFRRIVLFDEVLLEILKDVSIALSCVKRGVPYWLTKIFLA